MSNVIIIQKSLFVTSETLCYFMYVVFGTFLIYLACTRKEVEEEILTFEEYKELEPWIVAEDEVPKLPPTHIVYLAQEHQQVQ